MGNIAATRVVKPAFSWRRVALVGSISVPAAALCLYRIFTFVPLPFDAPHTLRPILYAAVARFIRHYDAPEQAEQSWATFCIVAILLPAILAFCNYLVRRPGAPALAQFHKLVTSRWLFFGSIGASLVLCRLPFLLANELNPDETFFIAAAEKLFRDPVFFRAVDFVSSGPLNVYPLMLPAVAGISPDYVSTRLIALGIILVSIYIVYRTLALLSSEAVARIAVLPAAGVFACVRYGDFLCYTSEHVSFLLLALALYVCVRTFGCPQTHQWRIAALGLLTSAAFLAKMQAVPMVGTVALVAIAYVQKSGQARRWWRPYLIYGAGAAPLLIINALVCVIAGVWHDFWMEYILGNYHYVDSPHTFTAFIQRFAEFGLAIPEMRLLIVGLLGILAAYAYLTIRRVPLADHSLFMQTAIVSGMVAAAADSLFRSTGKVALSDAFLFATLCVPASFLLLYRRKDLAGPPVSWFGFLAAVVLVVAAMAAYAPHRLYGHYFLLLIFPITIAMAWPVVAATAKAASGESPAALPFLMVFAIVTAVWQLLALGASNFVPFNAITANLGIPESSLIDSLTPPDGRITVWGWNGKLYVGAGRISGTKDLIAQQLFATSSDVRSYYRTAYLRELERCRPELFIDAANTSFGGFDQPFEVFPEIGSFIQTNYAHVLDAYAERFYIRRDLASSIAGIAEAAKCAPRAIDCFEAGPASWIPKDLPRVQMPEHASVEVIFTPETRQDLYATVFSHEASQPIRQGFQLQHTANDRYHFAVAWGTQTVLSKDVWLPQRKPAHFTVEFNGSLVTIVCNGALLDELHLPGRMPDSPGTITVGSSINHQRPFLGNVQLFQIRDLGTR